MSMKKPATIELMSKNEGAGIVTLTVYPVVGVTYLWQRCKSGTADWEPIGQQDKNYYSFSCSTSLSVGDKYRCLLLRGKTVIAYSNAYTVTAESGERKQEKQSSRNSYNYDYKHNTYEHNQQSQQGQQGRKEQKQRANKPPEPKTEAHDFFKGCTTWEQIKERYRKLMQMYHPDHASGDEEYSKQINTQYEALKKKFGE